MIPKLSAVYRVADGMPRFFDALTKAGFCGEIETGTAQQIAYATDNSIYQIPPSGIVFPQNADDLKRLASILSKPEFAKVSVTARGGGTGTNGQSLTEGVTVDCSRHMTRILEIDPVRRVARVEAGVVKDQLNKALKPHGLFFAPELSTSNRATIGGMISTDACGQGSVIYGKTSNHVLGLRVILADGTELQTRPDGIEDKSNDRLSGIYRALERIERETRADVAQIFPKLNRFMTGYDLAHLRRDDGRLNVNAILCGSEGTLGFIAEAELNLLPIPAFSALFNIRYANFNAALEDARFLTGLDVASIETIDEKVLHLAKGDVAWAPISKFFPANGHADEGINIVEIHADSRAELDDRIAALSARLESENGGRNGYTVATSPIEIEAIWNMRKRAVGLLGSVEGVVRPVAFVEDTAVPPENLAAYIREFRALLDSEGLDYGMFGHVDAGVLHVRPALDLTLPEHKQHIRQISDRVVALTKKHGGVLWGEHGKGVRSEYVPDFFGPLYPALQDIKALFDPKNQMNPGKIAAPPGHELFKIDGVPLRGDSDKDIGNAIREAFDNAAFCNGNGACFDFEASNVMCPSFKATGDRVQSPKGRASLMREWLRLLSLEGFDPRQRQGASFAVRLWNTVNPANRDDFSHEVRAALDTCLGCKACVGQCPIKVSVPEFRAKFLGHYYGRYLHPLKDVLVGNIEWTLPMLQRLRPLYQVAARTRPGRAALQRVGLTAMPSMPERSFRRKMAAMGVKAATPTAIAALPDEHRSKAVVLVADAFTEAFDPQTLEAAVMLALKLGKIPFLAEHAINGKPLHVHGMLDAFGKVARRTAGYLDALGDAGATLVGIDPSMTLVFRSEYKAIAQAAMRHPVLLPQEWLAGIGAKLAAAPRGQPASRMKLLAHCTERSTLVGAVDQWRAVFAHVGADIAVPLTGCCGMAGTFGHEVKNRALSERLYAMSWRDEMATGAEIVMATGYSCRSQVKLIGGKALPHPLAVLAQILGNNASSLA